MAITRNIFLTTFLLATRSISNLAGESATEFAAMTFSTEMPARSATSLDPSAMAISTPNDSTMRMETIPEVEISAVYKGTPMQQLRPIANTTLYLRNIGQLRIEDVKDLSTIAPNLFIPDYGSRMTSSVYVRGIGSRIDQPAMGLYVDGIPYLNKNGFDFDFSGIRSITVLRGPQNTLYGRNTMGGVIDIKTLSPLTYQGSRLAVDYGNGNTYGAKFNTYRLIHENLGWSLGATFKHSDGFYQNTFNGRQVDWSNVTSLNGRLEGITTNGLHWANTMMFDWVNQGGYPYRRLHLPSEEASSSTQTTENTTRQKEGTSTLDEVNYNDRCAYRRLTFRDGLTLAWQTEHLRFTTATAYQYLDDGMTMDQDFQPTSMFTLQQKQKEHTFSQDLVVKPADEGQWKRLTGLNLWAKYNQMNAPVTFKADGIETLILSNANAGIHQAFPSADLLFEESEFPIFSDFEMPSIGIALYHNSSLEVGHWTFSAGLRTDYEWQHFSYDNSADIHYRFTLVMNDFKAFKTALNGNEHQAFFEIMPRLAASWSTSAQAIGARTFSAHANLSRGYKSGGYNTQLFSDILQNRMMLGLMKELGISLTNSSYGNYTLKDVISYDPEYSWNYEAGFKFAGWKGVDWTTTLFFTRCTDQQLTVFPDGSSTGRLMTNAGRTQSYGAESEASYHHEHWHLNASYGYTHATFRNYNDGKADYRGRHIPYAPQHTAMIGVDYSYPLDGQWLSAIVIHADARGAGRIYWNEENSAYQNFYILPSASIELQATNGLSCKLWGKNLADTNYQTFYFVSMQNTFLQQGKPLQWGVTLSYDFN